MTRAGLPKKALVAIGCSVALSVLLLAGCAAAPTAETPKTVAPKAEAPKAEAPIAFYQGGEVTASEYQSWLDLTKAKDDPATRLEVATAIAAQESLAAAAEKRGVLATPAMRVELMDTEIRILEQAALKRGSPIDIAEDEIDAWLAEHGDRLDRPKRVSLSNIFKSFGDDGKSSVELRRRMEAIRQELIAGADWATVAMRESDSQTRFRRGKIGMVKPGRLEPAIEGVAFALAAGEISQVIETGKGLTLLRCDAVEEEIARSAEEKRERAIQALRSEKARQEKASIEAAWLAPVRLDLAAARLAGSAKESSAKESSAKESSAKESSAKETVVAEVKGAWRLSLEEAEILLRRRGLRRPLADLDEKQLTSRFESLAIEMQAAQQARELGLDQDPALRGELHWRRTLALATDEMKRRVETRFEPLRDDEIRSYFEQHQARFQIPETFQLAGISFRAESSQLRERYALGERIEADLRAGRLSFADAASRYSELPSAQSGGLLGWLELQQVAALGPQVLTAVKALDREEPAKLVQQPDGQPRTGHTLWLLQLLDRRAPRPATFEEARGWAENALGNERTRELQQAIEKEWVASLEVRLAPES